MTIPPYLFVLCTSKHVLVSDATHPMPIALCRCPKSTRQQHLSVLQGATALHVAAGRTIVVELLKYGADIASRDDKVRPTQLMLLKAGLCTAKTLSPIIRPKCAQKTLQKQRMVLCLTEYIVILQHNSMKMSTRHARYNMLMQKHEIFFAIM